MHWKFIHTSAIEKLIQLVGGDKILNFTQFESLLFGIICKFRDCRFERGLKNLVKFLSGQ